MRGKELVDYGITALIVYFAYKLLAPIAGWLISLIPTVAIITIVIGCIKMYKEK